jgi:hypothetical protein
VGAAHVILAAGIVAGMGATADADDYPYSGYFTVQPRGTDPADAALACAFGFTHQRDDGSFTSYHVDLDAFRNGRQVRYVEYGAGLCSISADGVEACIMSESADASEIGATYYDVASNISDDTVDTTYFDTRADAVAFARHVGDDADGTAMRFFRCPGFDDKALADTLGNAMSTLTLEQRAMLVTPQFTKSNRKLMGAILRQLGTED